MAARVSAGRPLGGEGSASVSPARKGGSADGQGCGLSAQKERKQPVEGAGGCSCDPPAHAGKGQGAGGGAGASSQQIGGGLMPGGVSGGAGGCSCDPSGRANRGGGAGASSQQIGGRLMPGGVSGGAGGCSCDPSGRIDRGGAQARRGAGGAPAQCGTRQARRGVLVAYVEAAREGEPGGLCVGSADPHCLRREGDFREPRERERATFAVGMLEEASNADLAERRLPRFNEAPNTAWREPPGVPLGPAPRVTKLTDVVPARRLREVTQWVGRLKACLRAAKRGNMVLARLLRPRDISMHTDHRVPGTEDWVWDLRPLQRGEPAEPLWPSGGERPPDTDLDLEAVREAAEGFADKAIVSELVHGVSDDAPLGGATVLSPPHLGALQHYAQVEAKVAKDSAKGWSTGGWYLPFWPVRANAYSVIEEVRGTKKKYRMVVDLSWPKWEEGDGRSLSVNASMDRSEWPTVAMPRPMQIAEAAAVLLASGGRVRLWGLDCEAYYRKVGRQKAEIYRNCVWVLGGFVVDPREQFGDASAAVKCVRLSGLITSEVNKELRRVDEMFPPREEWARQWLGARISEADGRPRLAFYGMFVDDGAGGSIDDYLYEAEGREAVLGVGPDTREGQGGWRGRHLRRAEVHFAQAVAAVQRLGHVSESSKEQPPSERLESLGCVLTLRDRRVRLTEAKRTRYAAEAEAVAATRSTCELRRLEEITHKLLYAATVFPCGRQWLHCLFRALRATYRLRRKGSVPLTRRMREALRNWASELRRAGHTGVPLAAPKEFPRAGMPGVVVTYSDASGDFGFGAWAWSGGTRIVYTCEAWGPREKGRHINAKELVAMAASTEAFLEVWEHATHVREFTDNTCAEWAAHTGTPRVEVLQEIMTRRVAGLVARDVHSTVARVATKENLWADWLSRAGGEARFLAQAAAMGLSTEKVPAAAWWRDVLAEPPELEES